MTLDPAEGVYVLAATWARLNEGAERDRLARWLAKEHPLVVIEDAALLAFDPPRGPVDLDVLVILLAAREATRSAVPPSPEAAFLLGEVGGDDLGRTVEDVFEGYLDP